MNFQTYLDSNDTNYANVLAGQPITNNTIVTITYANFNFELPGTIGGMTLTKEQIQAVISQVKSKGGKTILSFGGPARPYYLSKSNLWPDTSTIAAAIVNIIQTYGFDGCDLDIEEQQTANSFANKVLAVIQDIRNANPSMIITLTIPGQGWNQYWEPLAQKAYPLVDSINFKEYNLWIGTDYINQIQADISDNYIDLWGIPANKISMGLMPGLDNPKRDMTLAMTNSLTSWAKVQNLAGVTIWNMNRDFYGIDGNLPFTYTNAIIKAL